jgi:hypothetical protein
MKGRGEQVDGSAVLDRHYAAGGEGAAVPDPIDAVDDRSLGIAEAKEIGVQRMDRAIRRHGPACGDQGLGSDLASEDPLLVLARTAPPEEIHFQPLQVQDVRQRVW